MNFPSRFCVILAAAAAAAAVAGAAGADPPPDIAATLAAVIPFASSQLLATSRSVPPGQYPNGTDWSHRTGRWQTTGPEKWTAGYLCGCYWKMYALTGDASWAKLATAQLGGLEVYSDRGRLAHDFSQTYLEALLAKPRVPGAPLRSYRRVIKNAAAVLEDRYNKRVGAIRSWGRVTDDTEFKVIVDTMASLYLMPLAASLPGGKKVWRDIALSHARLIARNHFRADGSTYHLVVYNPRTGRLMSQGTHQGYSDDSTWSRGQAWAIVGYTQMYEYVREPFLLRTARRAADYFLRRLAEAEDGVPLWDFDVPRRARKPWKDSSAAAIAAAGLLRLGPLSGVNSYTQAGIRIVQSLARPGGYLARDATGPRLASILRNGTWTAPGDNYATGLVYGDFFFLDALLQLKRMQEGQQQRQQRRQRVD